MTARRFIVHKAGDATRAGVLSNLHAAIDGLDGAKAWAVELKPYRKPRTNAANSYLWACYALAVRELGFTAEEWHEEMCIRFFGKREREKAGGRVEVLPIRTTTTDETGARDVLTGADFWKFIEHMRREFSVGGVYIPDPTPHERAAITHEWNKSA